MPTKYALNYVMTGLETAPSVQEALCAHVVGWDACPPGEDRFTLRESLAHLADWEGIWLMRARRTVEEDRPTLPGIDENELAVTNGYSTSDPKESLRRYREGRAELAAFFRSLPESDWSRPLYRPEVGEMTLFELASLVLGHDGYHAKHTLESQPQRASR